MIPSASNCIAVKGKIGNVASNLIKIKGINTKHIFFLLSWNNFFDNKPNFTEKILIFNEISIKKITVQIIFLYGYFLPDYIF